MADSAVDLHRLILKFSDVHAYVVGDAMLDRYSFGKVERICPEAPVPVFVPEREEERPGGAANVVHQLAALGCSVRGNFGPRSHKHRLMVGHHQVLRIDQDSAESPSGQAIDAAIHELADGDFHVVVISDYAKGWASPEMCRAVLNTARRLGIPSVVDPKGIAWAKYVEATVICPNEAEWEAVDCHQPPGTTIVAKHGDKGLAVCTLQVDGSTRAELLPATARHVFDVSGAGDVVVAVVAAAVASGADVLSGAKLANLAAGWSVGEIGTTVCSLTTLERLIDDAARRE